MSAMIVFGSCIACGGFLAFNMHHCPSLTVNGRREPLCENCHTRWNEIHRTSKGLKAIPLHPEAYAPEVVE